MAFKVPYWIFVVVCCCLCQFFLINAQNSSPYGSPGIKLRLTRRGLEQIKNVGVKLLNEQLGSIKGLSMSHQITNPAVAGQVWLTEVQTTNYQPPTVSSIQFLPPSFISFSVENIALTLYGTFYGIFGPFREPGYVQGQVSGLSVYVTTQFKANPADGLMSVTVANCSTVVQSSDFLWEPTGPIAQFMKTFESAQIRQVGGEIGELFRQRIPSFEVIEKNTAQMFYRLAYSSFSEHFNGFSGTNAADLFIRRLTQGLVIDGRNVLDPFVTSEFMETQQRGELRYTDSTGSAPFYSNNRIPYETESDRMFYLYASEYTLNSLLYHAYQQDRLSVKIEESKLPVDAQGVLRTTCRLKNEFCVGKLIPRIGDSYPDSKTKFLLIPKDIPQIRMYEGGAQMDIKSRVITYAVDPQGRDIQIMESAATGIADIYFGAQAGLINSDFRTREMSIRLQRSAIGKIDSKRIAQLAPLAENILGRDLARGLRQGLPLPLQDIMALLSPQISVHTGYLRLAADFTLNDQLLRQKFQEAFEAIKKSSS